MTRPLAVLALTALPAVSLAQPEPSAQVWLQAASPQYTIHYVAEHAADVEFVRRWMDATERLMADKYGITSHGVTTDIYLEPEPHGYASVGGAVIYTASNESGRTALIQYLTPSAPAWREAVDGGWTTGLGLPYDEHYHAKTLVHEYITVAHENVRRAKPYGQWRYGAPSWWTQGLEEYDGMFHTTAVNREAGVDALIEYADDKLRDEIHCCTTLGQGALGTTNAYYGGMLILHFLAETYGERIHVDILRSTEPTFAAALRAELIRRGATVPSAFDAMRAWFDAHVSRRAERINQKG